MQSDEAKGVLSNAEVYEINQIISNRRPLNYEYPNFNYRTQINSMNNQPKYWKNPYSYELNRHHQFPNYPREFSRNVKMQSKPRPWRANSLSTKYNPEAPVFIRYPTIVQNANLPTDYSVDNEGECLLLKPIINVYI